MRKTIMFLTISVASSSLAGCGGNGSETGGTSVTGLPDAAITTTGGTTVPTGGAGGVGGTTEPVGTGGTTGGNGGTSVMLNPVPEWCKNISTIPPEAGRKLTLNTGLWDVSCNGGASWNMYITSSDTSQYVFTGYGFLTSELNLPAGSVPSNTIIGGVSVVNCIVLRSDRTDIGAPTIVGNGLSEWSNAGTPQETAHVLDAQTPEGVPCTMSWTMANQNGRPHCIAPVGCY